MSKFGYIVSDQELDFTYPDIWTQEKTTGPDRLVIAPRQKQTELLIDLMSTMDGPFGMYWSFLVEKERLDAINRQSHSMQIKSDHF